MNRYIMIRRLRAPAILLLAGVIALLHETGAMDRPWHFFWPLLLILLGVLLLAERTALVAEGGFQSMYSGTPSVGAPYSGTAQSSATESPLKTPDYSAEPGKTPEGGQS
jgi:hypothetical protein